LQAGLGFDVARIVHEHALVGRDWRRTIVMAVPQRSESHKAAVVNTFVNTTPYLTPVLWRQLSTLRLYIQHQQFPHYQWLMGNG